MNSKIGVAITTAGTPAFVELHLRMMLKLGYKDLVQPIIIDDSDSDVVETLVKEIWPEAIFKKNSLPQSIIDLKDTPESRKSTGGISVRHCLGDLNGHWMALDIARQQQLDYVVKFSRRGVPIGEWLSGLYRIINSTQWPTIGIWESHSRFPLRTECVAYSVAQWYDAKATEAIRNQVESGNAVLVESYLFRLGRYVVEHIQKTDYRKQFYAHIDFANQMPVFAHWYLPGCSRIVKNPHYLWHMTHKPEEYLHVLKTIHPDSTRIVKDFSV